MTTIGMHCYDLLTTRFTAASHCVLPPHRMRTCPLDHPHPPFKFFPQDQRDSVFLWPATNILGFHTIQVLPPAAFTRILVYLVFSPAHGHLLAGGSPEATFELEVARS